MSRNVGNVGRGVDPVLVIAWLVLAVAATVAITFTARDGSPTPVRYRGNLLSVLPAMRRPAPAPELVVAAGCDRTSVSIAAEGVKAAGHRRMLGVRLTNCGRRSYVLESYPYVRVFDRTGRPMHVRVDEGPSNGTTPAAVRAAPRTVTLRPGDSARLVVEWRTTAKAATPVRAAGLAITARGTEAGAQLIRPAGGFDLGATGRLTVGPWTRTGSD